MSALTITNLSFRNLQGLEAEFPLSSFSLVSGPSGAGATTLVFDVIGAEARRRANALFAHRHRSGVDDPSLRAEGVDSLPTDSIANLPFAVEIRPAQIRLHRDILIQRLGLWPAFVQWALREGLPHCVSCGREYSALDEARIRELIAQMPDGRRISILLPLRNFDEDLRSKFMLAGFSRIRLGDRFVRIEELHSGVVDEEELALYIDSFALSAQTRMRFVEAIALANQVRLEITDSDESVIVEAADESRLDVFAISPTPRCSYCGGIQRSITPQLFDTRLAEARCKACNGAGSKLRLVSSSAEEVLERLQLVSPRTTRVNMEFIKSLPFIPFEQIRQEAYSEPKTLAEYVAQEKFKKGRKSSVLLSSLFEVQACEQCRGTRLEAEARKLQIRGLSVEQILLTPIRELLLWINSSGGFGSAIGKQNVKRDLEILYAILHAVDELGVGYLTPSRSAESLSAGENERILLARGIRSQLRGLLYLVDQPSSGLHPADVERVAEVFTWLIQQGNTVIATDHHPELSRRASFHLLLGATPKSEDAGKFDFYSQQTTKTDLACKSNDIFSFPAITVNNVRALELKVPLGEITAIAGVSGSGKSSLLFEGIVPWVESKIFERRRRGARALKFDPDVEFPFISVFSFSTTRQNRTRRTVAELVQIDRSLQRLFAASVTARVRGLQPRDFSAVRARCPRCRPGGGLHRDSIDRECAECFGTGLRSAVSDIRVRGMTLQELESCSVSRCLEIFNRVPEIRRACEMLIKLGLGYLSLGRSFQYLSQGEQQRLLLARTLLLIRSYERILLALDEPVRGLPPQEIDRFISALKELTASGATVITIEHQAHFIERADHLIEIGPGAGAHGGRMIYSGPPVASREDEKSLIGKFLFSPSG